jgi:uronate dehydrogenase
VRIGNFGTRPIDKRRLSIWISPRDLTQLVRIGLEHPDVRYEIVYGVSNNQRSWYDNSNAYRLGYKPQDNSEPYAEAVLAAEAVQPRGCAVAVLPEIRGDYAGGVFAVYSAAGRVPP